MKESKDNGNPSAQNPYKLTNLQLTSVGKSAAGVPAVIAAFSDLLKEKIPLRGTRDLFKMNQFGGFDCPSCDWPDPVDERHTLGASCENGAKGLPDEATTTKVTA